MSENRGHIVNTAGALDTFLTAETNALKPDIYVNKVSQRTLSIHFT